MKSICVWYLLFSFFSVLFFILSLSFSFSLRNCNDDNKIQFDICLFVDLLLYNVHRREEAISIMNSLNGKFDSSRLMRSLNINKIANDNCHCINCHLQFYFLYYEIEMIDGEKIIVRSRTFKIYFVCFLFHLTFNF